MVEIVEATGGDDANAEGSGDGKKGVSVECRDCLASVGMAVWNCGTLEMDCIKNAIDLGGECYPCVCEILDYWWPDDAPNCFKKEITKITNSKPTNPEPEVNPGTKEEL